MFAIVFKALSHEQVRFPTHHQASSVTVGILTLLDRCRIGGMRISRSTALSVHDVFLRNIEYGYFWGLQKRLNSMDFACAYPHPLFKTVACIYMVQY